MNVHEVLSFMRQAPPELLTDLFARMSSLFSEKAEAVYQLDPENNGTLAQPYADIAASCNEAAMTFAKPTPVPDIVDDMASAEVPSDQAPSPWDDR